MLQDEAPFAEVIKVFLDWCGEDCVFISWNLNDIIRLEDKMLFYGLNTESLPNDCYDMQLLFDNQVAMEDRNFALSYVMWKMGKKPDMSHDALNDAMNTLKVMKHLDFSEEIEEYFALCSNSESIGYDEEEIVKSDR